MRSACQDVPPSRPVVLKIFYISYPFIKQDHQIYPRYTQWCLFLKKTKLTNSYSLECFIKICICRNLWFSKFIPLEDEIYPQGYTNASMLGGVDQMFVNKARYFSNSFAFGVSKPIQAFA